MFKKLIDPASDALIETIWSLLIEKGLKSLKGNYKQHLQKAINKTVEEYEKLFPTSEGDYRLHFYASAKANEFLARFVLFGEPLTVEDFSAYLSEDTRIAPPSQSQLEVFFKIFYLSIEKEKELKPLFIEENYKEKIFKISDSLNKLSLEIAEVREAIQELKATSPAHLTWLDKIQTDVFNLKFKTALEHLELLETELRKTKTLHNADHAQIMLLKGICLYEMNEIENGEEAWLFAWRTDPRNIQVKEKALRVQVDRGKFDSAKELIAELLQIDPMNPVAWAAKTYLGEGLLEEKLAIVPIAITQVETSYQSFKVRLAGFFIHHNQQEHLGKVFKEELGSDIRFPSNITFENKGYWLLLANLYLSQIAIEYNQIPDKVNPLVKNNPQLPKVVALYDTILKPLEATEKGRHLGYPKFWHCYATYCLEGSEQQALKVLDAFKELSKEHKVDITTTLTAFALLQTGSVNALLNFTEKIDIDKAVGTLIPRAFALAELGRMEEAQGALVAYFDKLERFDVMHLPTFLNLQSIFTPEQELKEAQWIRIKDKIENPVLGKLVEFFTHWDIQTIEQRRNALVALKVEIETADPSLLLTVGLLFFQNRDFVPSLEIFKPFVDFDFESPDHLYYIFSLAYSRHDDAELLERLEHWRRSKFTVYPDWLSWETQLLQALPDPEQILEVASLGIEKFPNDARFHMIKVIELERLGRVEDVQAFLNSETAFISKLSEPQLIQLSGIMLRSGLKKEGVEILFPLAENKNKEVARANYFFIFSMVDELYLSESLDSVSTDCWVGIEENGDTELIQINSDNVALPEYEALVGKQVGDVVEYASKLSGRKYQKTIKEIFDKYTGLYIQILRQFEQKKSLASIVESFDYPVGDIEEFNKKMVELFGEDGDRRKEHYEKILRQYENFEIGFSQLAQGFGGNPIEVYYHLTSQDNCGFQAIPSAGFRQTALDSYTDVRFALDFTSLLLFYELSEVGIEFSQEFLVSPFLLEVIEHRRFEVEWVKDSSISLNITTQGVRPTFYPDDFKQKRLAFFDKLLAWVKAHCKVRISRYKLTMIGHALRDERELGKKDNHFSRFFIDTLFLSSTPNESVVLISDDLGYYRFFHGNTNLINTETFLKRFYQEQLHSGIYPQILRLRYRGYSLPTQFIKAEFIKQVQGEEAFFDRCLKNLGTDPITMLVLLLEIYANSKFLIAQKRVMSQNLLSNFLRWGIPDRLTFETFQTMLVLKFRFLPECKDYVLEDWAIACGRSRGLISTL